jgi:hypothetical protein
MKRLMAVVAIALVASIVLIFAVEASPVRPPPPPVTIQLVNGLPATMLVGQSYTVTVRVTSPQAFKSAQAMPDDAFPGKGVVARGGARAGTGTVAMLNVTFIAKGSTASLPDGKDQVAVLAGARFANGQTVSQRFDFTVAVP